MLSDNHLSGRIAAFLEKLKAALPGSIDPGYHQWIAVNYPRHTCLMTQQRQRVIGIAWHCYETVTGLKLNKEQIRRVITWVERHPFTVVDEHTAMELFVRFHSDVPVHRTITTLVPSQCLQFSYPLVQSALVDK